MPDTTRKQRDVYADVRESLEEEGYTLGDMLAQVDIREALSLIAAEEERLTALARIWPYGLMRPTKRLNWTPTTPRTDDD
ncbi:hypothetical protein [Pseudomonas capsici]|uniref:Uncharacterized protein n=1 Tax=Pseudomonas capsici TaxID=2810614 RepID=A0ABT3C2Y3_9PSED|nr:hypothetical protein [Pseudomonas capsici]MBX8610268.1 hypothetical protein [Pseudomonas cichorii]MBN6714028.1 hypothetical protein [Pseudomonas capsici]MBN6719416.1 hypothetical protein [Pseudomonas capsici]MBN6722770.1 hypothetical protein [Pseudomonas capsici]MCV4266973.1 hypothetical protein [Pseudomonas capsici]